MKLINIILSTVEADECDLKTADVVDPSLDLVIDVLDAVSLVNTILG